MLHHYYIDEGRVDMKGIIVDREGEQNAHLVGIKKRGTQDVIQHIHLALRPKGIYLMTERSIPYGWKVCTL